jgi:hypothetical protein
MRTGLQTRLWRNAGSSSGGGPRERGQAQALLIRPRAGVSLVCNGKDASGNPELITVLNPEIDKITGKNYKRQLKR